MKLIVAALLAFALDVASVLVMAWPSTSPATVNPAGRERTVLCAAGKAPLPPQAAARRHQTKCSAARVVHVGGVLTTAAPREREGPD